MAKFATEMLIFFHSIYGVANSNNFALRQACVKRVVTKIMRLALFVKVSSGKVKLSLAPTLTQ